MKKNETYLNMCKSDAKVYLLPMISGRMNISVSRLIGYCHIRNHPGYLTAQLLREHECLRKKCPFLERFETADFWKARQVSKQCKKKRLLSENMKNETLNELIELAQQFANNLEYPIVITSITDNLYCDGEYIINYVSDRAINDSHTYAELKRRMHKYLGKQFVLRHIKHPDGGFATIEDYQHRNVWIAK